jgi:hypothetical protein
MGIGEDSDDATLVGAIRLLLDRHSRLVAEHQQARDVRGIIKPIEAAERVEGSDQEAPSSPPPSANPRWSRS